MFFFAGFECDGTIRVPKITTCNVLCTVVLHDNNITSFSHCVGQDEASSEKPHRSSLNNVTSISENDATKTSELSSSSSSLQRSVSVPTRHRSNHARSY